MSLDRQEVVNRVERERTDDAFKVAEPARNSSIAPRLIPVIVTILIGVVLLVMFFVVP
jgi:t-SNARE complex subunit (syntaxin)